MKKNRILGFVLAAVFAGLFCVQNVLAEEDESADVTVKVDEVMIITLSDDEVETVIENRALNIMEFTMFTETNNPTGAKVGVSVNTDYTELRNTDASFSENIPTIPNPITDAADFPATGWGFSTDGMMLGFDGTYNRFRPLGKAVDNFYYIMQPLSGEGTVAFGVRADNLPAGDYTNEVVFTMVANPVLEAEPKVILGANGNLNFIYDNEDYIVGNEYYDNLGKTEIVGVYDVPEYVDQYGPEWLSDSHYVYSINFDDTFAYYYPTDTSYWFAGRIWSAFPTNVQNLNMDKVTRAVGMFSYFRMLNQDGNVDIDLSHWNTSSLREVDNMFDTFAAESRIDTIKFNISGWDLSSVTDSFAGMFNYFGCDSGVEIEFIANDIDWSGVNIPFGSMFDTSSQYMVINANNWNIGSAPAIDGVFSSAGDGWGSSDSVMTINANNWDVHSATEIKNVFYGVGNRVGHLTISAQDWDISSATQLTDLFGGCGAYFRNATLDLSGWDTSNITSMTGLFTNSGFNTIYVSDAWSTESITDLSSEVFADCDSLVGGAGTTFDSAHTSLDYARIDTAGAPGYFTLKTE